LILIIFLFFIYQNINIGIIFLIGNLLLIIYIYSIYHNLYQKNIKIEKSYNQNESIINENLNHFHKIIIRGTKNNEINELNNNTDIVFKNLDDYYLNANKNLVVIYIIIYATLIIILGLLIYLYSNKKINLIICITFITILLLYRDLILSSFEEMPSFIEFLSRIFEIQKRMKDEFNLEIIKENKINNKNLNPYKKISLDFNQIEFKNIHFKYDSIKIFNNFNLKIDINNKIIGIIGIIPYVPFGPVLTITVSLVGQN
jgi:ABC-type multidrug transport system fused ATPase/permease subunit